MQCSGNSLFPLQIEFVSATDFFSFLLQCFFLFPLQVRRGASPPSNFLIPLHCECENLHYSDLPALRVIYLHFKCETCTASAKPALSFFRTCILSFPNIHFHFSEHAFLVFQRCAFLFSERAFCVFRSYTFSFPNLPTVL